MDVNKYHIGRFLPILKATDIQAGLPLEAPFTMHWNDRNIVQTKRDLSAVFQTAKTKHHLQLLMIFIGHQKNADRYKIIKTCGDLGHNAIHTICVRNVFGETNTESDYGVFGNIALKFNLKLNGENNHMQQGSLGIIEQGETMLIGMDVTVRRTLATADVGG